MFKCLPIIGCSTNRQVEKLDKSHCDLHEIPEEVLRAHKSLEECILDANHLASLPKAFFRLIRLRKLGLSDNEIEQLPPDIANLVSLQDLDVSRNDIQELPDEIRYCKALQILDISTNPLNGLPDGITHLSNLTTLCLSDLSLESLPLEFGNLSSLRWLELRDNLIRSLPSSFNRLKMLQSIDLGNNEMEHFPLILCDLPRLEELLMDNNDMVVLPPEIGKMASLVSIDFSENHIEALPDQIDHLANLTDLILSINCLNRLPENIGRLTSLSILKVDKNRLTELPRSIGGCTKLTELILPENELAELPDSVGNLSELLALNVDRNSLTELPDTICRCTKLTILSVRKNRIQRLPDQIGNLEKLSVLDVSGNLLPHVPISVSELKHLRAIWLSENQSQAMPKFQTDIDEETGADVLTCFLLPQQDVDPNYQPTLEHLRHENKERLASLQDVSLNMRPNSKVVFAGVDDTDSEDGGENQADPGYFTRHDTPHPREFKSRHANLFKNKKPHSDETQPLDEMAMHQEKEHHSKPSTPDGAAAGGGESSVEVTHVRTIQDNSHGSNFITGKENVNIANNSNHHNTISSPIEARRGSELVIQNLMEEPTVRQHVVFSHQHVESDQPRRLTPRSPTIEWPARRPDGPPPLPPRSVNAFEEPGSVQVQNVTIIDRNYGPNPPAIPRRRHSSGSSEASVSSSSGDYGVGSDGDEQVDGGRKRVGFSEDTTEKLECKLRRRDTPHYNRNRRVFNEGDVAEDAKKKVSDIMARRKNGSANASPLPLSPRLDGSASATYNSNPNGGDRFSYTNASTLSLERNSSPAMNLNEGSRVVNIVRQVNYTAQPPTDSDRNSESGNSGPVEVEKVRFVELPPPLPAKPKQVSTSSGVGRLVPVERDSAPVPAPGEIVKTVVTETYKTRTVPDAVMPQIMGNRSPSPHALAFANNNILTMTVSIRRRDDGLGLSIAGGRGSSVTYRGDEDQSIFISKVAENGPAYQAGLRVGDRVLAVNGVSVVDAEHSEAVDMLKNAGSLIILLVQRDSSSSREPVRHPYNTPARREMSVPAIPTMETVMKKQVVIVSLPKGPNGLGFSIAGGRGTAPYKENDESIFISRIAPDGTAEKSGNLFVGDRIVAINGVNIEDSRHSDAVSLLTGMEREVRLEVERDIPMNLPVTNSVPANVDPRTGKRYSYFVEPSSRVNGTANLRPSQSADFLTLIGQPQTTLPATWRTRNGLPESQNGVHVSEKVIESEKVTRLEALSKPGSNHELNSVTTQRETAPPPLKNRTKSVDGSAFLQQAIPVKSMSSAATETDKPASPLKVNRKLQVNTLDRPKVAAPEPPRLVTRSSQSDLVELVMRETEPPLPFLSQSTSFTAKTVTQTVDSRSSNRPDASPDAGRRSYQRTISYGTSSSQPQQEAQGSPPKPAATRVQGFSYTEPLRKDSTGLRSSLSRPRRGDFEPFSQEDVTIYPEGGSLGLSIVGGNDHFCTPFGEAGDTGIFISKFTAGGAAASTGRLRVGDRILRVNNKDLARVSHHECVQALTQDRNRVDLRVRHDPQPVGFQEFVIRKRPEETLGMNVRGGDKNANPSDPWIPGNPLDQNDDGIFISRILPDGAAARDGRLRAGMRILEINGESALGCSHEDALRAFTLTRDQLAITVCDGYDPEQAEAAMATAAAIQHLAQVSPIDAEILRKKSQSGVGGSISVGGATKRIGTQQQRGQPDMTAEQLHEELVRRHMDEALRKTKTTAENDVLRLQRDQKARDDERTSEAARRRQADTFQRQSSASMQDYIKREELRLAEEEVRRKEEWERREKQRWDEEMERRRQDRAREEEKVRLRRAEEERRIKVEMQEKLEADRRKREETLRQSRQRTPSAHSAHSGGGGPTPPSPPPPLGGWSSSTTTTTRTMSSFNSTVVGGGSDATSLKSASSLLPPRGAAGDASSSSLLAGGNNGRPFVAPKPSIAQPVAFNTSSRPAARGPLAAAAGLTAANADPNTGAKSPSAFTFKEKQMYFAKEIENQPDDYPARENSPPLPLRDAAPAASFMKPYRPRSPMTDRRSDGGSLLAGSSNSASVNRGPSAASTVTIGASDSVYQPRLEPYRQSATFSLPLPTETFVRDAGPTDRLDPAYGGSSSAYNDDRSQQSASDEGRPIRTAKAERRSLERQMRDSTGTEPNSGSSDSRSSSTAQTKQEAEKRAAWRADRLKSMEADALRAQHVINKMAELERRAEHRDSGFAAPSAEQTPTSEHSGFPRVHITEEVGEPSTKERSRLVDEKVHRHLEEHVDPETGKKFLTTTETVEQTVEHETETSRRKLIRLEVDGDDDDEAASRPPNGHSHF
ncbi:Protein lap4 [Hypsibius exemplaris]|uniref:Protein lap4 n=1 Tax=Hypsibius exemplaris TaxID=2072580 RepID=A0A1W0X4S1_HYPEX|nr:Protein lap4 [Hypsibius exemplaris]